MWHAITADWTQLRLTVLVTSARFRFVRRPSQKLRGDRVLSIGPLKDMLDGSESAITHNMRPGN